MISQERHISKKPRNRVSRRHISKVPLFTRVLQEELTYGPTRPATLGDVNAGARAAGAKPPVTMPPALPVPRRERENQRP